MTTTPQRREHLETIEVSGQPSDEMARSFWQAFARIALEVLDAEAAPREDRTQEGHAA